MLSKLLERENDLYDRLETLEGCENDPAYAAEVKELMKELEEIHIIIVTELF